MPRKKSVQTNNLNNKRYLNQYSAKHSDLGLVDWAVLSRNVLDSHYLYLLGVKIEKEKKDFEYPNDYSTVLCVWNLIIQLAMFKFLSSCEW